MKYHQAFFFSAQKINVKLDLLSQAVGVFQEGCIYKRNSDCSMIMRIQMNFVTIASFMRERCPWWETEYPWHVWARSWLYQEASMPASTAYWSVSRTTRELAMNIDLWVGRRRASYGEEWITLWSTWENQRNLKCTSNTGITLILLVSSILHLKITGRNPICLKCSTQN